MSMISEAQWSDDALINRILFEVGFYKVDAKVWTFLKIAKIDT